MCEIVHGSGYIQVHCIKMKIKLQSNRDHSLIQSTSKESRGGVLHNHLEYLTDIYLLSALVQTKRGNRMQV
jgi:hypothetical protein